MIVNNNHIPFLISWYDGNDTNSYYLFDFYNVESMIIKVIKDLSIRKYKNYRIYIYIILLNLIQYFYLNI